MVNTRIHTLGAKNYQRQKINQNQHKGCQRVRDETDRGNQQSAEDDGGSEVGFQQRDANARAKECYVQRYRDRWHKAQMFWTDKERKQQRDDANNKNDDIDGEAIDILLICAGHDQTEEPEDNLDCRQENRCFTIILQDILPDFFIAFLEDTCKQQFIFYL